MEKRLLAVVAHPDDESFGIGGTLARYAAEGVEVHIAIATDGVAGSVADGYEHTLSDLVGVRTKEVTEAVEVLGGRLYMLGFKDSGYIGDPANEQPNAFMNVDLEQPVAKISELMREIRPQVVITHDENGGYFHPDHIRCWQATTEAFFALRDSTSPTASEPGNYGPQRLYYSVIPRRMIKMFSWLMRIRGQDPSRMGRNEDIDFTRLGVPSEQVNVAIDYRTYWDVKAEAGARHPSQGGGTQRFRPLPMWLQRRFLAKEYFMQAYPQVQNSHRVYDLFAGLDENS